MIHLGQLCSKLDQQLDIGTYVDQESAVIVNDVHEILNNRFLRLTLIRPDDIYYFHLLTVTKFVRGGHMDIPIMEIMKTLIHKRRGEMNMDDVQKGKLYFITKYINFMYFKFKNLILKLI